MLSALVVVGVHKQKAPSLAEARLDALLFPRVVGRLLVI
jgi:hypothetical protein